MAQKLKAIKQGSVELGEYWVYDAEEVDAVLAEKDKVIAELKTNLSEIQSKKMQLEDDVALLRRNNAELKKEIESMKVKFREFNDNVCKKIVDASRTMSTISQDAQMDFYEEFIKEVK